MQLIVEMQEKRKEDRGEVENTSCTDKKLAKTNYQDNKDSNNQHNLIQEIDMECDDRKEYSEDDESSKEE